MRKIALIGNPNSGKSSLFNLLVGTRQKVGNYPGVTVDVYSAELRYGAERVSLLDMPGLYSMYPTGTEGKLVVDALIDETHGFHPDAIVYTVNASLLEAQLLLFTQLRDMGFPMILVVNMIDELDRHNIRVDIEELKRQLQVPVYGVSSRTGENTAELRSAILEMVHTDAEEEFRPFYKLPDDQVANIRHVFLTERLDNQFIGLLKMHHSDRLNLLTKLQQERLEQLKEEGMFQSLPAQVDETMERSSEIKKMIAFATLRGSERRFDSNWFDNILTDKIMGPIIFAVIMLFVFQAIFAWATYPMDLIESAFAWMGGETKAALPDAWYTSMITDGLLPGLGGVLVFVPQIAILFLLISILEEIGYMARAVYLFDRFMQRIGMNGRSVVALISGGACAIPAIMSTRTIENWRERLITILVTPFISCSARIPVFALLIAFVVPYESVWGVFNSQGLAFAGLYVLGVVAAVGSAYVFKHILKSHDPSFLMLELPDYRWPNWSQVWVEVRSKTGAFITEAGKIIVLISLILWFLASFGTRRDMEMAESITRSEAIENNLSESEEMNLLAANKLEASFAGQVGKIIEPVIRPLGYDWKIGIALITSFAAREVFVGSMATIYSVGTDETLKVREQLSRVIDPGTGKPVFNKASALSLLLFFVLAMQCMSTLAVVKKETGSWKWPVIQFTFMSVLAYVVSLVAYQVAS